MNNSKLKKLMRSIIKAGWRISPVDLEKSFALIYQAGFNDGRFYAAKQFDRIFQKEIKKERRVRNLATKRNV